MLINKALSVKAPRATYRVQLTPDFDFSAAAQQAAYLSALGVSHLYCSPYLQAARGSLHGYDVVDHHRVNDALGGLPGLLAWHKQLIQLRRETPDLRSGKLSTVRVHVDADRKLLILHRGRIMVACNLSEAALEVASPDTGTERILLASEPEVSLSSGCLRLAPQSVAILETGIIDY